MFWSFFIKYGKLLIDILIIAAIIFIIVLINPWNLFGGGLKLQNTANNVTAIKEIGQLITAEYYGEAIATYDQTVLKLIEEEDISDQANDIFRDMKQYVLDVHLEGLKEKDILGEPQEEKKKGFFSFNWLPWVSKPKKDFKEKLKDIPQTDSLFYHKPMSPEILGFYFDKRVPTSTDKNRYRNLLWSLFQEVKAKSQELNEAAFNEYMLSDLPIKEGKVFSEFHYNIKKKDKDIKKELKTDLAIIGRGWVKAGIDFGELNDQNFVYDEKHQIIHIYGVYPKILAKDINPWFIPEKQIPGFQILEARNANFEHAKVVKQYCIDKLEKMALKAGIIEQAERQSKETIKNFMALLTGNEIKEVHFHHDTISRITNQIFDDKFVSFEEAKLLDSIIPGEIEHILAIDTATEQWLTNQKNKELKQARLQNIIRELKKCYYQKRPTTYNRLSYLTTAVIADNIVTASEIAQLTEAKWSIENILMDNMNDSLALMHATWYTDSTLAFITNYNTMIDRIYDKTDIVGQSVNDTLVDTDFSIDTTATKKYYQIGVYENKIKYRIVEDTLSKDAIQKLKYSINVPKNWKEKLATQKGYFKRKEIRNAEFSGDSIRKLINNLNAFNSSINQIDCDSVTLTRSNDDDSWVIQNDPCFSNEDQKLVLQYILNHFITKSQEFNWFSTSSKKVKNNLSDVNIRDNLKDVKDMVFGNN
ncbi:DUF4230 domain-containing protein [Aquimarina brevivitae]|uniref:Uncharacterized protein n=1 Tax=Aquimarina brevivitae TaxID=323412 RepID=A0A4Q7P1P0_9FLAO|nr:DUF4230 domain-containing protein [Aquimarina brevivitae]RZS93290.1 hypothetical protein EV197_1868 [Aquimarina brevivitae]